MWISSFLKLVKYENKSDQFVVNDIYWCYSKAGGSYNLGQFKKALMNLPVFIPGYKRRYFIKIFRIKRFLDLKKEQEQHMSVLDYNEVFNSFKKTFKSKKLEPLTAADFLDRYKKKKLLSPTDRKKGYKWCLNRKYSLSITSICYTDNFKEDLISYWDNFLLDPFY